MCGEIGVITNKKGQVNLNVFSENTLLEISIIGYKTRKLKKQEILQNNNIVLLHQENYKLEDVVISVSKMMEKRENVAKFRKISPKKRKIMQKNVGK